MLKINMDNFELISMTCIGIFFFIMGVCIVGENPINNIADVIYNKKFYGWIGLVIWLFIIPAYLVNLPKPPGGTSHE
jgi:hypothetical protein